MPVPRPESPSVWLLLSLMALVAMLPTEAAAGCAPPGHPGAVYPSPDKSETEMVFYVQRSLNANTVVYAARLTAQGRLDPERPIEAYWRNYESGGRRSHLNWQERLLAYGVQWKPHQQAGYQVNIVSSKEHQGHLYQDAFGVLRLEGLISGRRAYLSCAYVQLKDDRATIPSVLYVDLYGRDLKNGDPLHERIQN